MIIRAFLSIEGLSRRKRIREMLRDRDVIVTSSGKEQGLWKTLSSSSFDIVFLGEERLSRLGERTVSSIRALPGAPSVIVFSGDADPMERARLLASGCEAVLSLDVADDTLREALGALVARRLDTEQLRLQTRELTEFRLGDFVSSSPSMRQLVETAKRVSEVDTTVLVLGETGVGKEWLARSIHAEGARAGESFVAVNCGAIPEGLVESQLFGHAAGAFTGATTDHRGFFELAHGGTIFLDEVAEMSPNLQVRLLRVLQERAFQRVGSERTIEVDIRVIAATNRDPKSEIESGRLREDLYYRIGVVTLRVPSLRERREDIRSIAENHFEIFCTRLGRHLSRIEPDAMDAMLAYDWPGNVRELINVMERAVLLSKGTSVTLADLPDEIGRRGQFRSTASLEPASVFPGVPKTLATLNTQPLADARRELTDAFEKQYLAALLSRHRGRVGEAAKEAGITSRALFDKMKLHALRKEEFKDRA